MKFGERALVKLHSQIDMVYTFWQNFSTYHFLDIWPWVFKSQEELLAEKKKAS